MLLQIPFGSFGEDKANKKARQLFIKSLIKQQQFAFALLCTTIGIGVILLSVLVARLVLAPALDMAMIATALGFTSDVAISGGAWRLFSWVSNRLSEELS